jgi:NADH-quinone oxidoreductase subunit M
VILTWFIAIPFLGGLLSWAAGGSRARWVALGACALELGLGLGVWARHPSGRAWFLEERLPWIPQSGISYHLALDGLSLLLLLLTGLLGMVAVLCSWREITEAVGLFHFTLLSVLAGIAGVFLAQDLILFYLFWELMLVPMYFLIGRWGHERRLYAALKFFLFTFIASLFLLAAILALAFLHLREVGALTFDAPALLGTPLAPKLAWSIMLGFFVGFAVKLPAVPLHPWLADAHTEAPTGGSVVLAGLLLKTGAYGLLRFALPLFPGASADLAPLACVLGLVGIIYGALLSFAQRDLKRLVAFSSISHMGFVLLGIYTGNELARQGAVMQIIAHGLGTGALFVLAGIVQERTGTRDLGRLGGLWQTAPRLGGFTLFFAVAAFGLPGLASFIGEFLVLLGAYLVNPIWGIVGALGFVFSLLYALRLVQDAVHGPNVGGWRVPDLTVRETLTLGVLAAVMLGLGFWPRPVFETARPALTQLAPKDWGEVP